MRRLLIFIILAYVSNSYSQDNNLINSKKADDKAKNDITKEINKEDIQVKSPVTEVIVHSTYLNNPLKNEVSSKDKDSKDCIYFQNYKDEIESYKSTKFSLVYQSSFAITNEKIYFSLAKKNDVAYVNVELIYIGKDELFGNDKCFGDESKIKIRLKNNISITILQIENEDCYKNQIENGKVYSRNLYGTFKLLTSDIEALRNNDLVSMEVFFQSGQVEYFFQPTFFSEAENIHYEPATYFMKNINCIDN